MLNEKIVKKFNEQINMEWFSAYFYLGIHNYYADQELNGLASWFNIQTQEERDHAMLMLKYLQNNSAKVEFMEVPAPELNFKNFREPIAAAFEHEKKITSLINEIYSVAYELKDFRTMQLLDWFVKEQNEEEKNTESILKKYDLFGNDAKALYLLDSELASRVYTAPSLVI